MGSTTPAYAIVMCSRCRDPIASALAAQGLIAQLVENSPSRFRVETVPCMAGCDRPLAEAFRSPEKATFLFGDIRPAVEAPALAAFGEIYDALPDGWCNEDRGPAELKGKTLAHIPAALQEPA